MALRRRAGMSGCLSRVSVCIIVFLAELIAPAAFGQSPAPGPKVQEKEHISLWHNVKVNDTFFWLREKTNPEVRKYLEAENAYTEALTAGLQPFVDTLYKEMLGHIKQTDLGVPVRRGSFYYYSRVQEGKQYPIRCRKKAAADGSFDQKAAEAVILDQNELAKGLKFLSVGAFEVSDDGNLLAYTTDNTGFRQFSLSVKDLRTGALFPDTAERVTSVEWCSDNRTLIYATEDRTTKRTHIVWRHTLGDESEVVYQEHDRLFNVGLSRSKDLSQIFLRSSSTDTWETRVLPSNHPDGSFKVVLPREKGHKYSVGVRGGVFYIRTNQGAKNFRLVTAPMADPSPQNWKEILPGRDQVLLQNVELFKDYLVVAERSGALDHFRVYDFRKEHWHDVGFPESVYSANISLTPEFDSPRFRFNYQSMVTPSSVFDYDMASGKRTPLKREEVPGYDPTKYATERQWAVARDGVKVPLSIVYRKGLEKNGKAPLFLYAYGSYGAGMSASFSSNRLALLDRGVVYVVAHIRGGNELGESWHDDGMLMKKKNTFFDFVDSAEWLIANGWTNKDRLMIEGASAGGLLMGAVTNLRPDLFRAVHAGVPFVDVMNTMMDASLPLTVGEYLEWGNPNEPAAYEYMRSYSPYDNLARKAYPAILVTTSFNDSQVMYWEPTKYVAKLRTLKTDANPLLLKCNMGAGHGGSAGRYDRLKEIAFEYAWLMSQVGIGK
ncbi:MAG TPA: S9 family peptidase [Gemmataceae bacterium]|nr:S9 family peptidase [Gemmataceae bacterium]